MRLRLGLAILALSALSLLFGPAPARALDITDTFSVAGFAEYEFFAFVADNKKGKANTRNEIQFHTEWIFHPLPELKAFVAPEFRFDGSYERRNRIFLDEAYIDYYTDKVDWRIGKQIISWGRADTIRPTDVWKIRDFTDFFADEEEGIVAVQARAYAGDFTVTGIWAPYFQRHTFPLDDERNRFFLFPTQGILGLAGCGGLGVCVPDLSGAGPYLADYAELEDGLPKDTPASSEGGAKLEYTYEGWDFSLSYSYLHDRFPSYIEGFDTMSPGGAIVVADDSAANRAILGLRPVYKRIHMIGTDGATTFDKVGIRWEAAYVITSDRRSRDPRIDDPYLQVTAGVDFTLSNLIGDQDLTVLVQYATDREVPRKGVKNIREGTNLRHFFEHGILAVVEWKFSEYLKAQARGFINVVNADHQIEPVIEWSPVDGLTLEVNGQIVGGTGGKDSFFTYFEKDDRVGAAARYSF